MFKPAALVVVVMIVAHIAALCVNAIRGSGGAPHFMLVDRECAVCHQPNRVEPEDFWWKCRRCGSRHALRVHPDEFVSMSHYNSAE